MATTPSSTTAHGRAVDGVSLAEIAARAGTPCYVYSAAAIRDAYTRLDTAQSREQRRELPLLVIGVVNNPYTRRRLPHAGANRFCISAHDDDDVFDSGIEQRAGHAIEKGFS